MSFISPEYQRAAQELELLCLLPHNWDTYDSPPTSPQAIKCARRVLSMASEAGLKCPRVAALPGNEGEVDLSFRCGARRGGVSVGAGLDEMGNIAAASYSTWRREDLPRRIWGLKTGKLFDALKECHDFVFEAPANET